MDEEWKKLKMENNDENSGADTILVAFALTCNLPIPAAMDTLTKQVLSFSAP